MICPELIEINAASIGEGIRVAQAIQRIVNKLSNDDLLAIDDAMRKDPNIIPKVLKVAGNPLVKGLFNKVK